MELSLSTAMCEVTIEGTCGAPAPTAYPSKAPTPAAPQGGSCTIVAQMTSGGAAGMMGGGAGGLELATRLGNKLGKKRKARITLVDAGLTHVWKPLLHEVASGSLDANANEINYRAHARKHHYEFQLGRMDGLDHNAREVIIAPFHDEDGDEVVPELSLIHI